MTRPHKLKEEAVALVRAIGVAMDRDVFPEVYCGGFLQLGKTCREIHSFPSQEKQHVGLTRGSATGQGRGPASGEGKAGGTAAEGSTGSAASLIREGELTENGRQELEGVGQAYDITTCPASDGLRVFWTAGLIRGLRDPVHFLTDIGSTTDGLRVNTWAWWDHGLHVGPRHTNYDGAACVFEARDASWTGDSSLIELFDMTTVWAFRHLHLRVIRRWPGRQILHTAFERMNETQPGELCGCGSAVAYKRCCQGRDGSLSEIAVARQFLGFSGGHARRLMVPGLVDTAAPD